MCILLGDYGDKLTMTTLSQSITSLTQNHSHLGWKRLLRSSIPASTSLYLCYEMAFILHGDPEKSLVLAQPFWIPFCGLMPSSSSSYGLISNCSLCYTHVPQTQLRLQPNSERHCRYRDICGSGQNNFCKTQKLCYRAERQREAVKPLLQIKSIHV